uniref:Uncharacterized protein n=1 Tax=Peromyscus maniculatus bairdii TaxID=230844 RepID=A0A8C8W4Q1_PERMB
MAPLPGALVPHRLLDPVHLLLVPALVLHGALLGLLQCTLQAPRAESSPARRSVSGTFSPDRGTDREERHSASSFAMVSFWALVFSFSFSYFFFHCSAVNSRFTEAVFLIVFALSEERRVDLVSASL